MCGKIRGSNGWFFFVLALFWVLVCVPGWTQANSVTYAQKLEQLQVITLKAKNLSIALTLKLTDSQSQIETLQTGLQKTQDELTQFKTELASQSDKAELSAQELTRLGSTASDLQTSLDKSKTDFQTYKTTAENKIMSLETQKLIWGTVGVGIGAVALETAHLLGWVK
jgi:chromosome segregation ATPase